MVQLKSTSVSHFNWVALPTRRRIRPGSLLDLLLRFFDPEQFVGLKFALLAGALLTGAWLS